MTTLDSMSEIICQGELPPLPRIEPTTPWDYKSDALFVEIIGRKNVKREYNDCVPL